MDALFAAALDSPPPAAPWSHAAGGRHLDTRFAGGFRAGREAEITGETRVETGGDGARSTPTPETPVATSVNAPGNFGEDVQVEVMLYYWNRPEVIRAVLDVLTA